MIPLSKEEVEARLHIDNPWWRTNQIPERFQPAHMRRRSYFDLLHKRLFDVNIPRAIILMGPRRIGKTVLIYQLIDQLLTDKVLPNRILHVPIQTPVYTGLSLERLFNWFCEIHGHDPLKGTYYVIYDEIQYMKEWEVHLKTLVDTYPNVRFLASGSAAAALRMKSNESGAGRFSDFLLPPLSFREFLYLSKVTNDIGKLEDIHGIPFDQLESQFIDYINFGGFPELIEKPDLRKNPEQYVVSDIIDKVLLRDLPSIYGIDDPRDLNRLFALLARNTGQEINLETLSKESGLQKNTLKKYMTYLEAAFLIQRLYRTDTHGNPLKHQTTFKVYLTNPSLYTAMYGLVRMDDPVLGHLVETVIMNTLLPTVYPNKHLYYWRKDGNEIDFLVIGHNRIIYAAEVKWSKTIPPLQPYKKFAKLNNIPRILIICRQNGSDIEEDGISFVIDNVMRAAFITLADLNIQDGKYPFDI